jgi:hypothetical protein
MRSRFNFCVCLAFLCVLGASPARASTGTPADPSYQVIVNAQVPLDQVNASTLDQIFMGERLFWDGFGKISPFHGDTDVDPMHGFIAEVLHLDSDRFQAHWRRKVFSGRGMPPRILQSDGAVEQEVARTKGGIGVISATANHGPEVKVLKVTN